LTYRPQRSGGGQLPLPITYLRKCPVRSAAIQQPTWTPWRRIRDLSEQGVRLDAIPERLQLVPDASGAELIRLSDYTGILIALREQNEQLSARVDALEKTLAFMQLPWWKRITQRRGKS